MKKIILALLLLSNLITLTADEPSIFGSDITSQQDSMVSIFAGYSRMTVTGNEIDEDIPIIDIGLTLEYAIYTRLYWRLIANLKTTSLDDEPYGYGDTFWGAGFGFGFIHKTFFGIEQSYNFSLDGGIDFLEPKYTEADGSKTTVDNSPFGYYITPAIGITYKQIGIELGLKYLMNFEKNPLLPHISVYLRF